MSCPRSTASTESAAICLRASGCRWVAACPAREDAAVAPRSPFQPITRLQFEGLSVKHGPSNRALRRQRPHVRIVSGARVRYRTGHSKTCRFCAGRSDERAQERAFRPHDANFFRVHLDALGQGPQMVAAVAARFGPHAPAGLAGEGLESLGRQSTKRTRRAHRPLPNKLVHAPRQHRNPHSV